MVSAVFASGLAKMAWPMGAHTCSQGRSSENDSRLMVVLKSQQHSDASAVVTAQTSGQKLASYLTGKPYNAQNAARCSVCSHGLPGLKCSPECWLVLLFA